MVIRPIAFGLVLGQLLVEQSYLSMGREQGEGERDQAPTITLKGTSKDLKTPTSLLKVLSLPDGTDPGTDQAFVLPHAPLKRLLIRMLASTI